MCSTHAFSNRSSTLPFPSPHVPLPMSPLCRVPYPSSEAGSSGAVRVPAPLCLPGAASGEAWAVWRGSRSGEGEERRLGRTRSSRERGLPHVTQRWQWWHGAHIFTAGPQRGVRVGPFTNGFSW
ncbi:unnamed protein product, partial [Closterium sp. Naga37s-1]